MLTKLYFKLYFPTITTLKVYYHFAASDLNLHCLPMSHKKDTRLIWVKTHRDVE